MPSTKTWTDDDRDRALQWIERKAARALFRDQSGDIDSHLERIRQAAGDLPDVLRAALTPEAWKALLNALRQRKHVAKRTTTATQSLPAGDESQGDVEELIAMLQSADDPEARAAALWLLADLDETPGTMLALGAQIMRHSLVAEAFMRGVLEDAGWTLTPPTTSGGSL